MSELLPCPFCGDEADFERIGTPKMSTIVSCTGCGARHESSDQGDHAGASWNRRATPPPEAGVLTPKCPDCGGHGVEPVYAGHGNVAEVSCGTCRADDRVAPVAEVLCRTWWGDDRAWDFFRDFDRERERWMRLARSVLDRSWAASPSESKEQP